MPNLGEFKSANRNLRKTQRKRFNYVARLGNRLAHRPLSVYGVHYILHGGDRKVYCSLVFDDQTGDVTDAQCVKEVPDITTLQHKITSLATPKKMDFTALKQPRKLKKTFEFPKKQRKARTKIVQLAQESKPLTKELLEDLKVENIDRLNLDTLVTKIQSKFVGKKPKSVGVRTLLDLIETEKKAKPDVEKKAKPDDVVKVDKSQKAPDIYRTTMTSRAKVQIHQDSDDDDVTDSGSDSDPFG